MKKVKTVTLVFPTVLSLTAVAHADVISSPVAGAVFTVLRFLPWILVGAVVGITIFLLRKFWKKKK